MELFENDTLIAVDKAVRLLNEFIWDSTLVDSKSMDELPLVTYVSDGNSIAVKFLDAILWNSNDDDRMYDDDTDELEDLYHFLHRKAQKRLKLIKCIVI